MINDDSPGVTLADVQVEVRRQEVRQRPRRTTVMASQIWRSTSQQSQELLRTWDEISRALQALL
jgi:hypothetical protein